VPAGGHAADVESLLGLPFHGATFVGLGDAALDQFLERLLEEIMDRGWTSVIEGKRRSPFHRDYLRRGIHHTCEGSGFRRVLRTPGGKVKRLTSKEDGV